MTDQAEKAPQFIVVRETKTEQADAQADTTQGTTQGNPFADARGEYPGLVALAREVRPTQVTLVPDGDGQITSDHGFDLGRDIARLRPLVGELCDLGCRVSLFVDAGSQDFDLAAVIGVQRIEIYTGPYAQAFADGRPEAALALRVRRLSGDQRTANP